MAKIIIPNFQCQYRYFQSTFFKGTISLLEIGPMPGTQSSLKTLGDLSTQLGEQVSQTIHIFCDNRFTVSICMIPGHYNESLEEFTFSMNEHYFLTDPDEMQFSHFPFLQVQAAHLKRFSGGNLFLFRASLTTTVGSSWPSRSRWRSST